MLSPKTGPQTDQQMTEMLKRVQKLELATNRILADSGKMGEGYMLPAATAKESAIALAQQNQIQQLLARLDEVESLSVRQQELLAARAREQDEMQARL